MSEVNYQKWRKQISLHHYRDDLLKRPRYQQEKRLIRFGYKVYSQSDEDGVLREIFARIGVAAGHFVEIGVETGLECNSLALLVDGWSGLWVEANGGFVEEIKRTHQCFLKDGCLRIEHHRVDRENVDVLLDQSSLSPEPDLLSIDIDGNDYWVWQAIESIRPRVAVIEYNATWAPPLSVTIAYDPTFQWDGSNYFGASLQALEKLGVSKGYNLVGCGLNGSNVFFVRCDLCGDLFLDPYTAANHYEPPRYYLMSDTGFRPGIGPLFKV